MLNSTSMSPKFSSALMRSDSWIDYNWPALSNIFSTRDESNAIFFSDSASIKTILEFAGLLLFYIFGRCLLVILVSFEFAN